MLLLFAVRRVRCVFCSELHWKWLLPRWFRWALGILLLSAAYVTSVGAVDCLHASGHMSLATYDRVGRWVYAPLNRLTGLAIAYQCPLGTMVQEYRDWCKRPCEAQHTEGREKAARTPVLPGDSTDSAPETTSLAWPQDGASSPHRE